MALVHDVEAPLVVVKEPSGYQKARCVSLPGLCRCVSDGNDYRTQIILERVVRGESRKQGRVTTWLGCYLLIHVGPSFHFVRHRRLAQCLCFVTFMGPCSAAAIFLGWRRDVCVSLVPFLLFLKHYASSVLVLGYGRSCPAIVRGLCV